MKTKYGLPRQVNPDSSLGFYRGYQGYSQQRLADECSVPLRFIQKLESGNYHVAACYIQPVADYIGISMDAPVRNNLAEIIPLLVAPPVDLLPKGDRVPYECKYPPGNCIDVYRRRKMLSYRQLAERMGVGSKQSASLNCRADIPSPKYIARLAELEGISPTEFEQRYAVEEGVA